MEVNPQPSSRTGGYEAGTSVRHHVRRKLAISLNTGTALLLAAVLVGMVNYLSYRYYARADWSRTQYYTLSEKTHTLLASLTNDINVVIFMVPRHEAFEDVQALITEYEYASPRIQVQRVDPHRELARTEALAEKYGVELLNVIVFDNHGRTKHVEADDLYEVGRTLGDFGQGQAAPTAFKGEQAFSSAIQSVVQETKPVVYYLQGHGERDFDDFDTAAGYSRIGQKVRGDNVELKALVLGEAKEVPADANAIVLAGPAKRLSQPEADLLARYLENNGRMLMLIDATVETGIEPVLERWGILVEQDVVVDATMSLTGRELFLREYQPHPITRGFGGLTTVMYLPRSVRARQQWEAEGDPTDQPRVTELVKCSESGWAETDLDQSPMRFDPQVDRPGPVAVAAAVERGPLGTDMTIRPTRIVAFGDSDFVANGALSGVNADFFMSALNWLLEREELMAIAPKPIEEMRLVLSGTQLAILFWAVVVGLPGVVAVLGGLVWLRRRN